MRSDTGSRVLGKDCEDEILTTKISLGEIGILLMPLVPERRSPQANKGK
jgi:hypothetical protein